MTMAAEPQGPVAAPAARRGRRRSRWLGPMLALAVVAAVIAGRWELRARWWAWRLTAAETPEQRQFYLIRLAAISDKSLGALPTLLEDSRPQIRDHAVTVLRKCTSPRAADLLLTTLSDSNEDVASAAALALAWRPDGRTFVPALAQRLQAQGADAWAAAIALGRIGSPEAESALLAELATSVPASVPANAEVSPGGGRPACAAGAATAWRRPARPSSPDVLAQVIDSLGLMGSSAAAPQLRAALIDHRRLTRTPHSLASARLAIAGLSGDLARQGLDPAAVLEGSRADMTVAGIAAHWLRLNDSPASQPALR